MNWVNRIETLISKSLSKIGLDGMAHIIVCQNLIIWLSKFFGIVPLWEAIIITIAIFILKRYTISIVRKQSSQLKTSSVIAWVWRWEY